MLDHLRALLFGRPTSQGNGASLSRAGSRKEVPQLLIVEDAAGDEGGRGLEGDVGELVVSPGADRKPYDEVITTAP